jgi:hypothetical protein
MAAAGSCRGLQRVGASAWLPAYKAWVSVVQRIQTLFIDDLDGSAAEGTVRFGLDGTEYEIDLNANTPRGYGTHLHATRVLPGGSAAALVGRLEPYVGFQRVRRALPSSVSGPRPRASKSKIVAECPPS